MESAVDAVEGRLKSPVKKQGVICRTLLKALLMECFAWLPPGSFPGSSARLFKVWNSDNVCVAAAAIAVDVLFCDVLSDVVEAGVVSLSFPELICRRRRRENQTKYLTCGASVSLPCAVRSITLTLTVGDSLLPRS